jgi:TRAP-type C4-dicarboxylate transport system permease small subunit
MNLKRIGTILLGALVLTIIIFVIDIYFYNDNEYNKGNIEEILLLSFLKGLAISVIVNIVNYYRARKIIKIIIKFKKLSERYDFSEKLTKNQKA